MLPRNQPDGIHIAFDDHRLVNNAGLILPATLALHLGLSQPPRCTACLAQSGRRGPRHRGPRPPTPPDVAYSAYPAVSSTVSTGATTRQGSFPFRHRGRWLLLAHPSSGSAFTRDAGAHGLLPIPFKKGELLGRALLPLYAHRVLLVIWLLAVEDSALHPSRAGRTTMASADFSGAYYGPTVAGAVVPIPSGQPQRSPRVSYASFPRSPPDLPTHMSG